MQTLIIESYNNARYQQIISIIFAIFLNTPPCVTSSNINIAYLSEYITHNVVGQVKKNKSLINIGVLVKLIERCGLEKDDNILNFFLDKFVNKIRCIKDVISKDMMYLKWNLNNDSSVKHILEEFLKTNSIINDPDVMCFKIDRDLSSSKLLINKNISIKNNMEKRKYNFSSLICDRGYYYAVVFYDAEYYIIDSTITPSIVVADMKDKYIKDIIMKEVIFVVYSSDL
jgi:hypothetical protein